MKLGGSLDEQLVQGSKAEHERTEHIPSTHSLSLTSISVKYVASKFSKVQEVEFCSQKCEQTFFEEE